MVFSALFLSTAALANNDRPKEKNEELFQILSTAKFAGACGILHSLTDFQARTQMKGGNALVSRFFNWEAARLGLTADQYIKQCKASVTHYDFIWKSLSK